ncbi:MAG: GHMP family kinase ATP-binding protein [Acidiferrobacteraceae bacterium]
MVISRTPFRVSFFGGGTDYPGWFQDHGGRVLTSTINRYCYISARYLPPFFETRSRIVWSMIEQVNHPDDIKHPAVRAGLKFLKVDDGVEIHHDGDLPARSGLGSSSAFTVGLLHALYGLQGRMVSKSKLAEEAIYVEQVLLKEAVGIQDQIQVAHGGINLIDIRVDGTYEVRPILLPAQRIGELQEHLLLFFTGISRFASEVAQSQIEAIPKKKADLQEMAALVDPALEILTGGGPIDDFGAMLHESWRLKRGLTDKVSSERIDEIYERARAAGALGGKLLGAGGGGFMLLFAKPERKPEIRKTLSHLLEIPFRFERSGTQIIFCDNGARESAFHTN